VNTWTGAVRRNDMKVVRMKIFSRIMLVALVAMLAFVPGFAQAAPHGGGFHTAVGGHAAPHAAAPAFRGGAPHAAVPARSFGDHRDFHRDFHHHGGSHVFVGVGPVFWWDPWPPVYAVAPPPVVVEQPPVYVEQGQPGSLPSGFWYYCPSAGGYYPNVPSCPEPWVPVTPNAG
jgi:hypothetical protein